MVAVMEHANRTGHLPNVGIVLRVSDVATSREHGAQKGFGSIAEEKQPRADRAREMARLLRILQQEQS